MRKIRKKNAGDPWARLVTETPNPRTRGLDLMRPEAVARLIAREDLRALRAVARATPRLAAVSRLFARTVLAGGRAWYVGAGTSGRLGVVDAAELPPTFGMPKSGRGAVKGVIAGGNLALRRSVEGAEDHAAAGARAIGAVRAEDLVIGISASSLAPFVRGALQRAKRRGAATVLLTMNRLPRPAYVDELVAIEVGPEVLTGSTRMKSGLATKAALHNISTTAMVLAGKVYGNRMVDVKLWCAKLRARGERLVADLGGVSRPRARRLLRLAGEDVKRAIVMARCGVAARAAAARLAQAGGDLRRALGDE